MNISSIGNKLAQAIRFRTISHPNDVGTDFKEFSKFQNWLIATWPLVFDMLEIEYINTYSILCRWKGSTAKPGTLYMAHYDVVPASKGDGWQFDPFDGHIKDGEIWGRGALDCKHDLVNILESTQHLIEMGFIPKRDIWLALCHDEEIGGSKGAKAIASLFKERNTLLRAVFNEGGGISEDNAFGIDGNIAIVSVAEKSSVNVIFSATGDSGHACAPTPNNAISKLATLISNVNECKIQPTWSDTIVNYFKVLAPLSKENQVRYDIVLNNTDEASKQLSKNLFYNQLIHSTITFTMLSAGTAPNIVPATASATANIRLLPGDDIDKFINGIKPFIGKDISVEIPQIDSVYHSQTPTNSVEWSLLCNLIEKEFHPIIILPNLLAGATDARYFTEITSHIFRFSPLISNGKERKRVHSRNERIKIKKLENMHRFLINLMREFDKDN